MERYFIRRVLNVLLALAVSFLLSYLILPILYKELPRTILLASAIILFLVTALATIIMFIRKRGS